MLPVLQKRAPICAPRAGQCVWVVYAEGGRLCVHLQQDAGREGDKAEDGELLEHFLEQLLFDVRPVAGVVSPLLQVLRALFEKTGASAKRERAGSGRRG